MALALLIVSLPLLSAAALKHTTVGGRGSINAGPGIVIPRTAGPLSPTQVAILSGAARPSSQWTAPHSVGSTSTGTTATVIPSTADPYAFNAAYPSRRTGGKPVNAAAAASAAWSRRSSLSMQATRNPVHIAVAAAAAAAAQEPDTAAGSSGSSTAALNGDTVLGPPTSPGSPSRPVLSAVLSEPGVDVPLDGDAAITGQPARRALFTPLPARARTQNQ